MLFEQDAKITEYVLGGADKSLAHRKETSYSDQARDLFNVLPAKLNTLLSLLL